MLRNVLLGVSGLLSFIVIANIFFSSINIFSASGRGYLSKDYVPKEWSLLITLILAQIFISLVFYFVYTSSNEALNGVLTQVITFVKINKKWFIFSGVASFIGLVSMGAPGFGFLISFEFLTEVLNKSFSLGLKTFKEKYHGDNMWPAAIMISLIWPWSVFFFNKLYVNCLALSSGVLSIALSFMTLFFLLFTRC